ncbi:MAG: pantetheine-phosphate adenylyltransferase, partial [Propionibacteriaceae bacterium]|nr:pantetheine-phosphate adenylyltransferase [Propionibacteriaceae bacterium]
ISRAVALFGDVLVGVGNNGQKKYLFDLNERVELVREAVQGLPSVQVEPITGLLAEFCADRKIKAVVKGLRFGADFDFELQMAHMNHGLSGLETILLPAAAEHVTLSSTMLREVARYGGDVDKYVPAGVRAAIRAKQLSGDLA